MKNFIFNVGDIANQNLKLDKLEKNYQFKIILSI